MARQLKQFVYDMIHMTEGEKLVNYWWLWLSIVLISFATIGVIQWQRKK